MTKQENSGTKPDRFGGWYQDPRRPQVSYGRHSVFVKLAKFLLLLIVIAVAVLLVSWPNLTSKEVQYNINLETLDLVDGDALPTMESPKFQGVDEAGQPYNVRAKTAVQHGEDHVSLTMVEADISTASGGWITLSSNEGLINPQRKHITLTNQVNIMTADGIEFSSDQAEIDLNARYAEGNEDVVGQAIFGNLFATGFFTGDNGDSITFKGPIKMIIFPALAE